MGKQVKKRVKRYSYAAYPDQTQQTQLAKTFGSTRVVYNKYVELNQINKKLIGYSQACENLTLLKKELPWLTEVSSIALQQTLKDATQGVKNHFLNPKKVKLPRFKKRSNQQSFRIVGGKSFKVNKLNNKWSEVVLPKMSPLKFRTERPLPSNPSSVTIIKSPSGKYQASFVVETETTPLPITTKHLALDLGLNDFAITVDTAGMTEKVSNPRYYRTAEKKLGKLQHFLSRKQKGSNNREKARIKVARQHEKIANQRKDFVRKLVNVMVSENQTIITETLAITNMLRNHSLSKSIMDASWGMFLTQLSNKCAETGRTHYRLDRFFPSSKTCSNCGVIKESLNLSERTWICTHCNVNHDRDVNAAINLLVVGLKELAAGRAESQNASLTGRTTLATLNLTV